MYDPAVDLVNDRKAIIGNAQGQILHFGAILFDGKADRDRIDRSGAEYGEIFDVVIRNNDDVL